jgi:S1-C subfamily serine protease
MNTNLKVAFAASIAALIGLVVIIAQHSEKYVAVVEAVQDKAVMIEVPSVYEQMTFRFNKKKMTVETSTVPTTFMGSGVIIKESGFTLSCAHVFETPIVGPIVGTLSDGTTHEMRLIYKSTESDLALLKIEGTYPFAAISKRKLHLGQEVIAVGNPHGLQFSTTHGIISHLGRDIRDKYTYTQVDAPINAGNSGGPLFNLQGELIGINARKWTGADGLGLAISPSTINEFLSYFGMN